MVKIFVLILVLGCNPLLAQILSLDNLIDLKNRAHVYNYEKKRIFDNSKFKKGKEWEDISGNIVVAGLPSGCKPVFSHCAFVASDSEEYEMLSMRYNDQNEDALSILLNDGKTKNGILRTLKKKGRMISENIFYYNAHYIKISNRRFFVIINEKMYPVGFEEYFCK